MLRLDHVYAKYNVLDGYVHAVDDVNFTINDNEIFGIAGESGCGKSTLLKVMYDLIAYPLEIESGKVSIDFIESEQKQIIESGAIKKAWWKAISYVPQGAMHVMNPVARVESQFFDTVSFSYHKKMSKAEIRKKVADYFEELDLSPDVLRAYPHQLSGGMRQRVLIALATFLNPSVILADEPTTALDVVVQKDILMMLMAVQKKLKNSMVIVSHDMGVHYQVTTRMGIMYAGQIVEIGPTEQIFQNPQHPYTKMLIGALPKVGDHSQKEGISGTPPSLKNPPSGCRFAARCKYTQAICHQEEPKLVEVDFHHQAACLFCKELNQERGDAV